MALTIQERLKDLRVDNPLEDFLQTAAETAKGDGNNENVFTSYGGK